MAELCLLLPPIVLALLLPFCVAKYFPFNQQAKIVHFVVGVKSPPGMSFVTALCAVFSQLVRLPEPMSRTSCANWYRTPLHGRSGEEDFL